MFHASVIHFSTSFLPVYFGGAAFVVHNAGRIYHNTTLKIISYRLFMLTSIVTTLTCGFGGASIRGVETVKGINQIIVKTHAWTAMMVFLLSLILAFYAYKALRVKGVEIKNDKILFIFSIIFLVVFVWTTLLAFRIR